MNETDFSIVPQPTTLTPASGAFALNNDTRIKVSPAASSLGHYLKSSLAVPTGLTLAVQTVEGDITAGANEIVLSLSSEIGLATREGYRLQVTPDHIEIRAATAQGLFYGLQTLRQLLPVETERQTQVVDVAWTVPAVTIEDAPKYSWRGLHLDVARHFFPVAFIKKFLDLMALHKLNVFHWHLTEDQGWRIEIKKYPKLTTVGSQRSATPFPADRTQLDGKPYGGFYTQEEVREVVAYAAERFITVVPEIEMPGHAVAALASYPELGCTGQGYEVRTRWGIAEDVFCAGNDQVFTFLQDVLTEVLALFPSEFIHIGGDECPKVRWQACPKCQARIKDEGLADEYELQSYFIRRIEKFLTAHKRRLIGWDEILEGGLAPNATVMSWRGSEGGIEAAEAGHDVVMSPNTHCYFDYYQSEDTENEPPAIGRYLPLEKVYAFDPAEGISADKAHHVLGGQGNIWTEYMPTFDHVEYMAYPRATALAEAVWSAKRDYADFSRRLRRHLARLDELNVHYRNPF